MSTPTEIRIRSNFFLWLLTGRSKGFANASLSTGIDYAVDSTPVEVTYARKFLGLDVTTNDFNVLSVMAASMMSKAMLREMVPNVDVVFVPGLLRLPRVTCSATLLGPDEHSWAHIDGSAAGAQGFTTVTITRLSATTARIETDKGTAEVSAATLTPVAGGAFRLHVENAKKYGIFADFGVTSWTDSAYLNVDIPPTRFPFVDVARRLRTDRTMMRLMNAEGTLATFEASPSNPALQVGMAGLAIIRRMLKWTNDAQAGYTVATEDGTDLREPLSKVYKFAPALIEGMLPPTADPSQPAVFDV